MESEQEFLRPNAEHIDIRPSPRLLTVLGDIKFAAWQCLAELVDNAFDDFLDDPEHAPSRAIPPEPLKEDFSNLTFTTVPQVSITLPGKGSSPRDGEVWIKDSGRGMNVDRLNMALRAGWTGNARHGQLGLFGMGFNIATARLGNVTEVRTTRAGDLEWVTVRIDLQALQGQEEFLVPVRREPKNSVDEHGTEIIVSQLRPELHEVLSRQEAKIRDQLGDVYSYLLRERGFALLVNGKWVKPRLPCVWSPHRQVVRSGDVIPAVIKIDEVLPDQAVCQDCGKWQDPQATTCQDCQSQHLEVRERRIHGWVGVQRYLDKKDFGIDFLRNGRKILLGDKSLFSWVDVNEVATSGEQEYPIEIPATEGRLVGEIHCDHVKVNYQKNAFEYDTPEWRKVVRSVRGDAPLRPKVARSLGYGINRSPLGQLFAGYRRNDPGLDYLTPGNGKTAAHEKAREWAGQFRKGAADYQSDERWHDAAANHDEEKRRPPAPEPSTPQGGSALGRMGIGSPAGQPTLAPEPPAARPAVLSDAELRDIWRDSSTEIVDLRGRYRLHDAGAALEVTVLSLSQALTDGAEAPTAPVTLAPGRGSVLDVFVNRNHPLFVDFAADVRDVVITELAEYVKVRASLSRSLSEVSYELREA